MENCAKMHVSAYKRHECAESAGRKAKKNKNIQNEMKKDVYFYKLDIIYKKVDFFIKKELLILAFLTH